MEISETSAAPSPTPAAPSESERFLFDTNGYLVLENFLAPDHVARLLEATNRSVARRREQVKADPFKARFTVQTGSSTRILYILDDDPLFLEMMDWPGIIPYVKELFNPKFHHLASDAIVDFGADLMDRTGGWHRDGNDGGYDKIGFPVPLLQLKVGYYLTDMTQPGNANLTVVPGSHKSPHSPPVKGAKPGDPYPGAVQVCAPAGSAILFHNALWHTAAPFASPTHHRTMLYFAYEHTWMMACEETWNYSKDFYNRKLSPAQRKYFHGHNFDPMERRQGWG